MSKTYKCENETCGKQVSIRSTIKEGPNRGLKVCSYCKYKLEQKVPQVSKIKPIKKYTSKNIEKRKEERKDLPSFFSFMAKILSQRPICDNCGCKIDHFKFPVNNIAHILSKRKYKSVMTNPNNILFLCTSKDTDGQNCHERFDSSISIRESMPCFAKAKEKYKLFKDFVVEYGNEKTSLEK
jgi:hypothetical protein